MILKRKNDTLVNKVKPSTSTINKESKNPDKKPKKLQTSVSMRNFKLNPTHHSKINKVHAEIQNNGNYANTMMNNRNIHDMYLKVEETETVRQSREHKNTKMRKSASAGVLKSYRYNRRSLSPAGLTKQIKQNKSIDIKHKYSSKHTNRSEKQQQQHHSKQKLKSFVKKAEEPSKKQQKPKQSKTQRTSRNNQSEHLKTDISSKMPSIHKDFEKKGHISKKNSKKVTLQKKTGPSKQTSKPKKKTHIKNSIVFSDVSFNDISLKNSKKVEEILENQYLYERLAKLQNTEKSVRIQKTERINQLAIEIRAAITIQRHFRGYLTRRCIQQLKQMTYSAIKIQKVFRGYICRKRINKLKKYNDLPAIAHPNKKNLSIENSLITIKDFNEDHREQKHKTFKFFNFEDENISSCKKNLNGEEILYDGQNIEIQNRLQFGVEGEHFMKKKQSHQENKKYIEILEDLLMEEGLKENLKERIRSTLRVDQDKDVYQSEEQEKEEQKENYVKNKINSEIISEKSFNSPRSLCSPKASIYFPSPNSNKSKSISKIESLQICNSPRTDPTKLSQRIISPCKNIADSNSVKKPQFQTQKKQIRPFDTTFEFIEEFQLIIVDFLRDNTQMKDIFLKRVKNCEKYRTLVVLNELNDYEKVEEDDDCFTKYLFHEEYMLPCIFDEKMKSMILDEPAMKIHLEEKNYLEAIWSYNEQQKQAYQAYITLIFDGLTQAIYRNYRNQILTKQTQFYGSIYQGHDLFKFILMNSLTYLQGWCQYLCGMEIPVEQNDPNFGAYAQKNNQRMQLVVNSDLRPITVSDCRACQMQAYIKIGQIIFEQLVEELACNMF